LAFLWQWIGLTRSLWCFLGVFGKKKWIEMGFLGEKTTDLVFPVNTVVGFWNGASNVLFFYIYLRQTTRRFRPIKL
jgi:hypothetical protein